MRWTPSALAMASALVLATFGSWAAPAPRRVHSAARAHGRTARVDPGVSLGSPTEGHLNGGMHLETQPYLRISPAHTAGDVRWGVAQLVQAIDRAARLVHDKHPDAVLTVGHLSRRGGGDIESHHSHESGRDADIQFYMRDRAMRPLLSDHYLAFRADGTTPQWPGAHFDDARNWELVKALLTDPRARVMRIFVSEPLKQRLLDEARRQRAPGWLVARASQALMQPKGALPHDNHFHLRIACPFGMRQCIDSPTVSRPRHVSRHPAHPNARRATGGGTRPRQHANAPEPAHAEPTSEDSGEEQAHPDLALSVAQEQVEADDAD